jgi:hypothetical protein
MQQYFIEGLFVVQVTANPENKSLTCLVKTVHVAGPVVRSYKQAY